jgi:hypothetical protein
LPGLTTPNTPPCSTGARGGVSHARSPLAWQFAGEPARAVAARIVADETPRRKYVKDLIRAGRYVAQGREVLLSVADIDELVKNTTAFIEAGNDVPVPDGHTKSATANRGYLRELFREGDTLYGVIEMIGEDGIATAARSKVSIGTDTNYADGMGNVYSHVITHVALTNEPVVPDQNGFVPLAASRGAASRALVLSLANTENSMESLTKIAAMLGVEGVESLDEAALVDAIVKAIEAMKNMSKTASADAASLKSELVRIKASLAKPKPEPDPMLLSLAAKNRRLELDQLVRDGRISAAVKDKLIDVFVGADNSGLKLSLDQTGDGIFNGVLDALRLNETAKLGGRAGVQGVALSRATPDNFDPVKAGRDLMATIGIKAQA